MSRDRGQALVETVLAIPACLVAAMGLVECGVLVRDRVVTSYAASRAAQATIVGGDAEAAAMGALPESLQDSARVIVRDDSVEVRVQSMARTLPGVGTVEHSSSAVVDAEAAR